MESLNPQGSDLWTYYSHESGEYEQEEDSDIKSTLSFQSEFVRSEFSEKDYKENGHLVNLEYELYWAIRIDDTERFLALGGDHLELDFDIEVEKAKFYKPIVIAAVMGKTECLKIMIKNKNCVFDNIDHKTGVNAFWMSAFYGQSGSLSILANAGANVFVTHNVTKANALHVAIQREHP